MQRLAMWEGAVAGFMLTISVFDLLPEALSSGDLSRALCACYFVAGCIIFAALKHALPEPELVDLIDGPCPEADKAGDRSRRQLLFTGILTAISIAIHNFPEGLAVYAASSKGVELGVPLTIAVALHNIPEGFAVALHVFHATHRRFFSFFLALLSGLAEPLAVILAGLLFQDSPPEVSAFPLPALDVAAVSHAYCWCVSYFGRRFCLLCSPVLLVSCPTSASLSCCPIQ